LAGTPCIEVCNQAQPLCVKEDVADRYPLDTMLADIGAISYRGEPLLDQQGKAIGLLWVIDDKPCNDLAAERALMQVASKRATLELQRLDSEKLLAERNELLYGTLDRISDGFFSLDLDWNFTFVNNTAALMINSSWCDLEGQNIWDTLPEMASFFFMPLKKAMKTQQSVQQEGFYPPLEMWLEMYAYPSTVGITVYFQDISERKKLEQEQHEMEQRMQRAQKMEAVGQLTAGIAHDFNNILTSVMGYTELALSRCGNEEQDKLAGYLRQVYTASERGRDLVLQMLSFSRKGNVTAMPIDPLPLVKETTKMLRSTFPASIDISIEAPSEGVPDISISEVQFQQMIMNLCVNARDAMNGKGQLTLTMGTHSALDFTCSSCHQLANGEFVEVAISDSGEGIEPHKMPKLFEPFYTTKEVGQGTGLGLSIVHGIIHEHGGHIKVETSPTKGSTFHLFFPAINPQNNGPEKTHNNQLEQVKESSISKRMLVVDDEQALLNFLKEVLENEGFKVEAYSDSQKALADFKQDPSRFDLVITDLTMPKLIGTELAHEIRLLHSDIPIILCSGYNDGSDTEKMPEHKLNDFLQKPFNRATLLSSINGLFSAQQKKAES
jgi:signal transduction histidine kinase/ActR/RegA family two-component response regulator